MSLKQIQKLQQLINKLDNEFGLTLNSLTSSKNKKTLETARLLLHAVNEHVCTVRNRLEALDGGDDESGARLLPFNLV